MVARAVLLLWALLHAALAGAGGITETDDAGHAVSLAEPARRIVSLAPNITEILFHVGAGSLIIGADEYSNYPEAAKSIPRLNNHATANYEAILGLAPDLVIGWQSGNGAVPGRIRALGLPVFEVEPHRLDDIPALFLRFGRLTGHTAQASARAEEFSRRLRALRAAQAEIGRAHV